MYVKSNINKFLSISYIDFIRDKKYSVLFPDNYEKVLKDRVITKDNIDYTKLVNEY